MVVNTCSVKSITYSYNFTRNCSCNCSPIFAILTVVPNVFDIDENNSHDEDNTPVSNLLLLVVAIIA